MKCGIVALTDYDASLPTVRRVEMIGKGLLSRGHELHVVIAQRFRPGPLVEERNGITVHWGASTTPETWTRVVERVRSRWATICLIRKMAIQGLDWLILYNLGLEAMPLLTVAHRRGTRVAVEYCDLRGGAARPQFEDRIRRLWHGAADSLVPRCTDLNLAISRFLEEWLRNKAPDTDTMVVPPLVDVQRFQDQPEEGRNFRARWKIGEIPTISYLGSYWFVEGVANLLKAASQLVVAGERFKLVISGAPVPGRDSDDVPAMIREMGLADHVVQTGWLPTEEVIAAMSAADILVVAKIDHVANRAGLATKMVEYLSMGRAVVATRVGDVSLYLRHGEDSLLCAPGDVAELTDALRCLLRNLPLRKRLGVEARRTAYRHFDYRAAGKRLEQAMMRSQRNGA